MRGFAAPLLLVLQHDIVPSQARIVAPVVPVIAHRDATVLTPHIEIESAIHRVMLLDMASVPIALLGAPLGGVSVDLDDISAGLDAIFKGYPVGLARA